MMENNNDLINKEKNAEQMNSLGWRAFTKSFVADQDERDLYGTAQELLSRQGKEKPAPIKDISKLRSWKTVNELVPEEQLPLEEEITPTIDLSIPEMDKTKVEEKDQSAAELEKESEKTISQTEMNTPVTLDIPIKKDEDFEDFVVFDQSLDDTERGESHISTEINENKAAFYKVDLPIGDSETFKTKEFEYQDDAWTNARSEQNAVLSSAAKRKVLIEEEFQEKDEDGDQYIPSKGRDITGKKVKRSIKWIVPVIILIVLAAVYFSGFGYYQYHFLPNTMVNDINLGNLNAEETQTVLSDFAKNYYVVFRNYDQNIEAILGGEIDYQLVDREQINAILSQQNQWKWPITFFEKADKNSYPFFEYDHEKLEQRKASLNLILNADTIQTENAYPVYADGVIEIKEEIWGNTLDTEKFNDVLNRCLITGVDSIDLQREGCYPQPQFTKDSPDVAEAKRKMETALSSVVTYTFGEETVVLDQSVFASCMSVDSEMNVVFGGEQLEAFFIEMAKTHYYNDGTTGNLIDIPEEINILQPILIAGEAVTREPVYSSLILPTNLTEADHGTFVVVNKGNQTVCLVDNWGIVLTAPVVTGNLAADHDTPTGSFRVTFKETDKTMRGPDWEEFSYYWMPFNGDYGMHDADTWRTEYGGEIYKTNGSHGCVNMSLESAAKLYAVTVSGTPVIVHE